MCSSPAAKAAIVHVGMLTCTIVNCADWCSVHSAGPCIIQVRTQKRDAIYQPWEMGKRKRQRLIYRIWVLPCNRTRVDVGSNMGSRKGVNERSRKAQGLHQLEQRGVMDVPGGGQRGHTKQGSGCGREGRGIFGEWSSLSVVLTLIIVVLPPSPPRSLPDPSKNPSMTPPPDNCGAVLGSSLTAS